MVEKIVGWKERIKIKANYEIDDPRRTVSFVYFYHQGAAEWKGISQGTLTVCLVIYSTDEIEL